VKALRWLIVDWYGWLPDEVDRLTADQVAEAMAVRSAKAKAQDYQQRRGATSDGSDPLSA
jgi:hypothetical protein